MDNWAESGGWKEDVAEKVGGRRNTDAGETVGRCTTMGGTLMEQIVKAKYGDYEQKVALMESDGWTLKQHVSLPQGVVLTFYKADIDMTEDRHENG